MLERMIPATMIRFFRSFVVAEAESVPEFIRFVRGAENPEIWIYAYLSERNKPGNEYWLCDLKFVSNSGDGTTVVLRRQERIALNSAIVRSPAISKYSRYYVNTYLLKNCIGGPVCLMATIMPKAKIEVRDLYDRKTNLAEFERGGRYSIT